MMDDDSIANTLPSLQPFWTYLEFIDTACPSIVALNFFNFLEYGLPYFANLPFFGSSIIDDLVFVLDDLIPIFPVGGRRRLALVFFLSPPRSVSVVVLMMWVRVSCRDAGGG